MGLLDQIANPQMADIAGALDYREARLARDEAKRKDIRLGQLVAESLPGIRPDSPLYEMAQNSPREFSVFAKSLGIPLNSAEQFGEVQTDVENLYMAAQMGGPQSVRDLAVKMKDERNAQGRETPVLDKAIAGFDADPQKMLTSLFVTHRSINGDKERQMEIEDRKLSQQDRQLDIQEQRMLGGDASDTTSDKKNWDEYQRLKETSPEDAAAFGRSAGFVGTEGQKLSAFAEKEISKASDEYTEASNASSRYGTLAGKLRTVQGMGSGLKGSWQEYIKEQTGSQDAITALRKEALQIANSEGIKNLPPGSATDRDIEIVMAPFPTEKSDPKYVADWLDAVSRLNDKRAQYAEFKSDFIAKNGSFRDSRGNSMAGAWKSYMADQQEGEPKGAAKSQSAPNLSGKDQQAYEWAQANPNDPRAAAILQKLGAR